MSSIQDGIILLDKARGITSAKAIAQVKRKLNIAKIGHAGTLDPLATGLLVCLLGKATKLATQFQKGTKCYAGTFLFGHTSNTDDIDGEILSGDCTIPSIDEIRDASRSFIGSIQQIPPKVSAIKQGGARAYDMARKGIAFELSPREVCIESFEIFEPSRDFLTVNLGGQPEESVSRFDYSRHVGFRIVCSSGTYIRSIARDLGQSLACGGLLSSLRRERSAPFSVSQACLCNDLVETDIISMSSMEKREELCHR